MLAISAIQKSFGGIRAVDGCTFDIPTGAITGLIGPNGAGKTTLFNIIAGLLQPDDGRVLLDGRDITGLPPHKLFHLGLVRTFQLPRMFERLSVVENLMLIPPGQGGENIVTAWLRPGKVRAEERRLRQKALEVLDFLQLTHVADEYAGNLSGGQKKLIELGRTLMTDARLVLLDEPGAGVNPTLLGKLCEDIRRLNREFGRTICIIEHDMDLIAALCQPVVVMVEGRVLVQGTMAEIRRHRAVQEAYLGSAGQEATA